MEKDYEVQSLKLERESDGPTQEFYVCFSGVGDWPGASLCKQGFSHVSIMERVPLGFIVHDANRAALDTYILPSAPLEEFLLELMQRRPDYTVMQVIKKATNRERHLIRFGLQSCVTIVSYILGIKLPFYSMTPYSLYKRLIEKNKGDGIISTRRVNYVERTEGSKKS